MKPDLEIAAAARPMRAAFIIEDGEGVHPWLDAAFNEAFSRHGGRQSLVVPVMNGDIPEPRPLRRVPRPGDLAALHDRAIYWLIVAKPLPLTA